MNVTPPAASSYLPRLSHSSLASWHLQQSVVLLSRAFWLGPVLRGDRVEPEENLIKPGQNGSLSSWGLKRNVGVLGQVALPLTCSVGEVALSGLWSKWV